MAYVVDRVVICDAYQEPNRHYQLLPGGRSKRVETRRPSMRFLASAKDVKGGIGGIVGKEAGLFDDLSASSAELNAFVNQLRDEVRAWREAGYPGTAAVTRRLLEWWFERDEERRATGKRFFFCQQEAVETVIYLYEVQGRRKMPETGDLVRYALKLATGTGKTVVMALFVTWATLHKRKVSGSSLSANFLVLVPNLTVRDRVSGQPRGDGLDPSGEHNLYDGFEMVPPEYREEFHPNVLVRNWQGIPLEGKREDWIGEDEVPLEEGRFIPQAVLRAMQRRARQDPNAPIRRLLGGWRDLVVINDEAHHVYGEKRGRKGDEAEHIKWSKILGRIGKAVRLSLVIDLSATPWYGSGSPKPEGTLFEWLVSDFSVYDVFESGLVKVVRLPDPDAHGRVYLDLWDLVKGAKTKEEYLRSCKGAIASIYSSWKKDHDEWASTLEFARGPAPVLLCVTSDARRMGVRAPDARVRAAAQRGRRRPLALGDDPDRLEGVRRGQRPGGRDPRDGEHRRVEGEARRARARHREREHALRGLGREERDSHPGPPRLRFAAADRADHRPWPAAHQLRRAEPADRGAAGGERRDGRRLRHPLRRVSGREAQAPEDR
jgi:type III restriction enzyme